MTNEEFQKLVLEQLGDLKIELSAIKSEMVTKEYIEKAVVEQQKDVMVLLQHIDKKLSDKTTRIEAKISVLNNRLLEQEARSEILQEAR